MTGVPSELSDPTSTQAGFWPALQAAARQRVMAPMRSASALLTGVGQLRDRLLRRWVPRLDSLGVQLQEVIICGDLGPLEQTLATLQDTAASLDVLAARTGGPAATELARGCIAVTAASQQLAAHAAELLAYEADATPVVRLLWIELLLEAKGLDQRSRAGLRWLGQVEQELAVRAAMVTAEVSRQAVQALARRGEDLQRDLQSLHELCAQARDVHASCEQLAQDRSALCQTLQQRVQVAGQRLQQTMLPLVCEVDIIMLEPADLMAVVDARHELQVALTQAQAGLERLQESEEQVTAQLAGLATLASQAQQPG